MYRTYLCIYINYIYIYLKVEFLVSFEYSYTQTVSPILKYIIPLS